MNTTEKIHVIVKALVNAKLSGKFLTVIKTLYETPGIPASYEALLEPAGYPRDSRTNLGIAQVIGKSGLWDTTNEIVLDLGICIDSLEEIQSVFLDVAEPQKCQKLFQLSMEFRQTIDACDALEKLLGKTHTELLQEFATPRTLGLSVTDFDNLLDKFENTAFSAEATGHAMTHEKRKAVEMRAMRITEEFYSNAGWHMEDTSQSDPEGPGAPYDFLATKDGSKKYIEVKGTTTDGANVLLTHGEVAHAQNYPAQSVLVVISGIVVTNHNGETTASGGQITFHADPWIPEESRLKPTVYRYQIFGD